MERVQAVNLYLVLAPGGKLVKVSTNHADAAPFVNGEYSVYTIRGLDITPGIADDEPEAPTEYEI